MRAGWGLVVLVLALAIVAVLARKQLSTAVAPPLSVSAGADAQTPPSGTALEQSRAIPEQVKHQVDTQMHARPILETDK